MKKGIKIELNGKIICMKLLISNDTLNSVRDNLEEKIKEDFFFR